MISNSVEETVKIGEKLAKKLKRGSCVALVGDLGSGKTVLTKGIARGLGVKNARYVNSPTFVIIKEYSAYTTRKATHGGSAMNRKKSGLGGKGKLPLYHFDLYRLNKSSLIDAENFEEYFYGDGVTVIEWADKIANLLPRRHVEVSLKVTGESRRKIVIRNK